MLNKIFLASLIVSGTATITAIHSSDRIKALKASRNSDERINAVVSYLSSQDLSTYYPPSEELLQFFQLLGGSTIDKYNDNLYKISFSSGKTPLILFRLLYVASDPSVINALVELMRNDVIKAFLQAIPLTFIPPEEILDEFDVAGNYKILFPKKDGALSVASSKQGAGMGFPEGLVPLQMARFRKLSISQHEEKKDKHPLKEPLLP